MQQEPMTIPSMIRLLLPESFNKLYVRLALNIVAAIAVTGALLVIMPPGTGTGTGGRLNASNMPVRPALAASQTPSWSIVASPNSSGGNVLNGVSCVSASFCMATGSSGSGTASLAESWNGSSWSIVPSPNSTGGSANLSSVSCTSASFCMAIGSSLAESWRGSSWSIVLSPNPTGGSANLSSVSCTSASFCMATGFYYASSGSISSLAETWNGSSWSIVPSPNPTGSSGGAGAGAFLSGVSCTSASFCMATGTYYTSSGGNTLAESWNGTKWSIVASPNPTSGNYTSLSGVSCTSASFCMATGLYEPSPIANDTLAESWNGTSWSLDLPIDPAGAVNASLNGVSCEATICTAAGSFKGTGSSQTLVETAKLSAPPTPQLSGVSPSSGTTSGGTPVTITGANLSGATAVDFGSTPATNVSVVSSTEITATSPAGSGTVPITITSPEGTSSSTLSCADSFTYGAPAPSIQPGSYTSVSPFRVADTRANSGKPYAGQTLSGCSVLNVQVTGIAGSNVPANGVAAIVANITAVDPSASGYLTVYPTTTVRPVVSNLNFSAGKTVANLIEVPVSSSGQIAIYNGSSGATNVLVDVAGYVSATGASYTPISPLRVCDTRTGNPSNLTGASAQCNGKTLSPNTPLSVSIAGSGLLPLSATAAVINLTAIAPEGGGYLTAYPASSSTPPTASNVNFQKGELISNRAIVELSSTGEINLVSNTTTNVLVDVSGYYSGSGASYIPLSPARIADSRCSTSPSPPYCAAENIPSQNIGFTPLGAGSTENLTVAGIGSVPLTATAVVLNVTVATTTNGSYLTIWPSGSSKPTASDLNWTAGTTIPNLVVAEVGANGQISIYNNAGSVEVIADIEGYYG